MRKLLRDFISEENRQFKWKVGSLLASSLAGFVAGIAVSVIFMRIALNYLG